MANTGWARWTPLNLAGIAAHLAGGVVLTGANKGRLAGQQGVAAASTVKTALTVAALGTTAYARVSNAPPRSPRDWYGGGCSQVASSRTMQEVRLWTGGRSRGSRRRPGTGDLPRPGWAGRQGRPRPAPWRGRGQSSPGAQATRRAMVREWRLWTAAVAAQGGKR